jgi:hypothetical protein
MALSREERESLTRQLFEAVDAVGFLTWKQQYPQDAAAALAGFSPEQLRDDYFREFERTAGAEIREMAGRASDDRLRDSLHDWTGRAQRMATADRQRTEGRETTRSKRRDWEHDR